MIVQLIFQECFQYCLQQCTVVVNNNNVQILEIEIFFEVSLSYEFFTFHDYLRLKTLRFFNINFFVAFFDYNQLKRTKYCIA